MTCYSPLTGYVPLSKLDGGRLVFNSKLARNPHNPIKVPCSACVGCRADRAGDWAVRSMHEAAMHPQNCFITLTFDDEHLPETYSVHKRTYQLFQKKLRKHCHPKTIRFYACGEYGPENLRPHYHALIFNHDFPDKKPYKKTPQGDQLYTSEKLSTLWGFGFCTTGDVTYQSAGYVAQYVQKKITGDKATHHYLRTNPVSGAIVQVEPEFSLQSRNPGLGSSWFDKFQGDCFPSDFLVVDGKQRRVPQFYLSKLKQQEAYDVPTGKLATKNRSQQVKRRRKGYALTTRANSTPERLRVRELVKKEKLKLLKRTL